MATFTKEFQSLLYRELFETTRYNFFGIGGPTTTVQDDITTDPNINEDGVYIPPKNCMKGKVVLITGGSSGLGLESAKRLTCFAGATVVLTSRSIPLCEKSVNEVKQYCYDNMEHPDQPIDVRCVTLDLEDFASVRTFPDRYRECMATKTSKEIPVVAKIDVLMNNAGAAGFLTRQVTIDGFERTFQSCHLGPFLLTASLHKENLLNDHQQNDKCLVINLSSVAHQVARIINNEESTSKMKKDTVFGFDFNNLNSSIEYSSEAYSQSKLANILFTKELHRRSCTTNNNCWLTSVSIEPGLVATDVWRHTSYGFDPRRSKTNSHNNNIDDEQQPSKRNSIDLIKSHIIYRCMTPVDRGANSQIWLACSSACSSLSASSSAGIRSAFDIDVEGGKHYDEFRQEKASSDGSYDEKTAQKLWKICEELTGIKFEMS
jgi:NAD(P)-dependent dehydrogenase (short-subunit alcohol dehydrogenase family)